MARDNFQVVRLSEHRDLFIVCVHSAFAVVVEDSHLEGPVCESRQAGRQTGGRVGGRGWYAATTRREVSAENTLRGFVQSQPQPQ
jgi:hypothetical protein